MKVLLLILLTLNLKSQTDDVKHFYAGFGISVITSEVTNQLTDRPVLSCLVGGSIGITAGALKECVYDREMKRGVYSNTDMFLTGWGSVIGSMCMRVKFDLQMKKRQKDFIKLTNAKRITE